MTTEGQTPSTMLSSSTQVGRLYGQGEENECLFDIGQDAIGRPVIMIRTRKPFYQEIEIPNGTSLLVQLFEQPDVLWLAHATLLNGDEPMICYAPIEPLESTDGRVDIPALADVTLEQVDEAVQDAMRNRDSSKQNLED